MGFPSGSGIKNPSAMQDTQEMWVWSPGGEHGNPFQYSCLENSMDRGAWQATVYRVAKSQTRLKQLGTHVSLTECFLDTGLWCWCFMWMNSLIHTAPYKVVTTVIPFYQWGIWGTEVWSRPSEQPWLSWKSTASYQAPSLSSKEHRNPPCMAVTLTKMGKVLWCVPGPHLNPEVTGEGEISKNLWQGVSLAFCELVSLRLYT